MATRALKSLADEIGEPFAHPNLNSALVAAQGELNAPRKDREVTVKMKSGGTYKFSYATMAGMIELDRPVLARHGLGFVQFVSDGEMVTRIIHRGGEYMDCPLPMPNLPNAPQEAGSVITYFKRYSYAAAFGRVADEEDDANIAEGNGYDTRERPRPTTGETPPNKRVQLDGPYASPTALKTACHEFAKTLEGVGDMGELIAWEETPDYKEFVEQVSRDAPQYWFGSDNMPGEFIPLVIRVANKRRELEELESVR